MAIEIRSVPPWKIEKVVSKGDYNYVVVKNHPHRTKLNYVFEHRVVMENHLLRILESYEVVHHKNGNKKDNRIENLEVMTNKEHNRYHQLERGRSFTIWMCPFCKKEFETATNASPKFKKKQNQKLKFCSRKCAGSFYAKLRKLDSQTEEMKKAISGNLLSTYIKKYMDKTIPRKL